jgi:glycerophosphoryl diester phosphodiesterase
MLFLIGYIFTNRLSNFENNSMPKFIAHAGGGINGLTYTNSYETLEYNYKKGFRFFEADIRLTKDGELVLIHDWNTTVQKIFNVSPGSYSLAEFKLFNMTHSMHQMTMEDLNSWTKNHSDAYIITDVKNDNLNLKILEEIKNKYPELAKRIIPQIYYFEEFKALKKIGYNTVIFTDYMSNYSNEEILNFAQNNDIAAITMPIKRALNSTLPEKLKDSGIVTYAHTVNDTKIMNELNQKGVYGIYTDILFSED